MILTHVKTNLCRCLFVPKMPVCKRFLRVKTVLCTTCSVGKVSLRFFLYGKISLQKLLLCIFVLCVNSALCKGFCVCRSVCV